MEIRLAAPLTIDSIVDGPGLRAVIWTQGCHHNCLGCHNPMSHDIDGGFKIDTKEIIHELKGLKLHQGITLSGGEPFLQPKPLIHICNEAKKHHLNIWAYSGYTFEELINKNNPNYKDRINLLKFIDVLVDGKFILNQRNLLLKFRGSENQRILDVKKSLLQKRAIIHFKYLDDHTNQATQIHLYG